MGLRFWSDSVCVPGEAGVGRDKWAGKQGQVIGTFSLISSHKEALYKIKKFFLPGETETVYRKTGVRKMASPGLTEAHTSLYPEEEKGSDGQNGRRTGSCP